MDDSGIVIEGQLVGRGPDTDATDTAHPEAIQIQDDLFDIERAEEQASLVYKRNEIIHGQFSMRTLAMKTFSAVISKLDPRSTEFHPVNFTRAELARLIKMTRQSMFELIDDLTDELQKVVVKVPYIDRDWEDAMRAERAAAKRENRPVKQLPKPTSKDSYVKVSLFEKAAYNAEGNLITFVFNERLKDYLIDLRGNFTYYQLNSVLSMSSGHAIRIYEILRSALSLKSVEAGTRVAYKTIEYAELRNMLDISPRAYPRFSLFERDVLRMAQKQMDSGDLSFTYTLPDRVNNGPRAPVKIIRFKIFARSVQPNSGDWKITFTEVFTENARSKLSDQFSEARLQRNVEYYREKLDDGTQISKVSSWLRKAFKEDFAGVEALKSGQLAREPLHTSFIKDQLLPMWLSLSDMDRDEFLERGFDQSTGISILYEGYRTLSERREVATRSKAEQRAAVTDAILNPTDW